MADSQNVSEYDQEMPQSHGPNHTLQPNPWHCEEETQNTDSHMTAKLINLTFTIAMVTKMAAKIGLK